MQTAKRTSTDATAADGPGRVLLGLGGTVDHELVWNEALIQSLADRHGLRLSDCDASAQITDERSLVAVILGFALAGRGGEVLVPSSVVIEAFSDLHDRALTLGGTCVRAALVMRALGLRSTVHLVSIDDDFRRLFPADCDYISSAETDGMYPHVIIQLPATGSIQLADGEVTLRTPNRVILTNDPPHVTMVLSPDFTAAVAAASVVLVSGFNSMTNERLVAERLVEVESALAARAEGAIVVAEDAGFHRPELHAQVRTALARMTDVFSLNEDELQGHLGRSVDLLDPEQVAGALDDLHGLIPAPVLVVHTRHWALASGPAAASYREAIRGGVRVATARFAHGDAVTAELVAAIDQLESPAAHREFAAAIASPEIVCIPAYAIDVPRPTTIGLGDSFVGGLIAALTESRNSK